MIMEGVKGGEDDMGEGSMQCSDHPYRNSNPGGICAFCLQEKLGKLVSSSFPVAVFPSSSSSSPSFRSEVGGGVSGGFGNVGVGVGGGKSTSSLSLSLSTHHPTSSSSYNGNDCHYHHYHSRRARIPFLLTQRRKKKKEVAVAAASASSDHNSIILKRSKSTTTPRRRHFLDADDGDDYSSQKRGFWSFLYLTKSTTNKRIEKNSRDISSNTTTALTATPATTTSASSFSQRAKGKDLASSTFPKKGDFVAEEESPNSHASAASSSFDRKVSRSRSVGCGSRSFSGDFFERISTGFGDCTLRRVESQREGKPKPASAAVRGGDHHCIKERVKCGGIFSGFIMTSSSSSSSSSSYWVSSSAEDMNGKTTTATATAAGHLAHGRSKSWGWAFASPIRAFSKPSSNKDGKSNKTTRTPNLAAIPSLLAVRG
ncbi:hypothetical protein L1049_016595 [Liquidambar formosana]|uniref:Vitellogenin-like protein n=1 Tax=Liquidambar formosana TaxID=63359 RepID=A0AAP0S041_LIQFO